MAIKGTRTKRPNKVQQEKQFFSDIQKPRASIVKKNTKKDTRTKAKKGTRTKRAKKVQQEKQAFLGNTKTKRIKKTAKKRTGTKPKKGTRTKRPKKVQKEKLAFLRNPKTKGIQKTKKGSGSFQNHFYNFENTMVIGFIFGIL